jgi:hypothetical protein
VSAPTDIQFGALRHERECPICGHDFHVLHCGDDLGDGVTCPCHAPVPGIY